MPSNGIGVISGSWLGDRFWHSSACSVYFKCCGRRYVNKELALMSCAPAAVDQAKIAQTLAAEADSDTKRRGIATLATEITRGQLTVWRTGVWRLQIVKRSDARGFEVLPKRWIVERTFAWISRNRRLARDFERYATTVAAFVRLAMIRIMLRRLAVNHSS
jgi:transposase